MSDPQAKKGQLTQRGKALKETETALKLVAHKA